MSDKQKEIARLLRRLNEENIVVSAASKNLADATYKIKIINEQLNQLNIE